MSIVIDGNGTITGLTSTGISASQAIGTGAINSSNAFSYSGAVVKVSTYTNSTRYAVSSSANYTVYTFPITKLYASGVSNWIITAIWQISGTGNDGNYGFVSVDGTNQYIGMQLGHTNSASADTPGIGGATQVWTGLAAGSHTIGVGWKPVDGTSNQPVVVFHTNTSDGGRNQQGGATWIIYEVLV
jgi:hypothetical protein